MKKLFTFTILFTLSMSAGFSQLLYDTLALPNHIVGRSMNEEGEITKEYPADFTYYSNNDLSSFVFPEYEVNSEFFYDQGLLNFNVTTYSLLEYHEQYYITHEYEYENGLLQRENNYEIEYTYQNDYYQFIDYYYDEEERLLKKEDSTGIGQRHRWLYDYQNNGKTLILTYYIKHFGNYYISKVSTYQYDDDNLLREVLIENHDIFNGNINEITKQTYTYTERKKPASEIKQTLVDNEWVNTTIHNYIYGNNGRIAEQQDGVWSEELNDWDITNKVMHEYSNSNTTYTVSFYKKSGNDWVWDDFRGQKLFFEPELKWQQNQLKLFFFGDFYHRINQIEFSMTNTITFSIPEGSEWYYEIQNDDGSITYQHLEYTADTTINNKRPKIIIRSNTQYDRDWQTEVTHEYILEENNKVYWWNKDLHEFTTLYDYNAEAGDEWEVKVGLESFTVHVDSTGIFEYEGTSSKVIHISDAGNYFSGDIVVGYGHMTSFFPEKLMRRDADFTVNGLRCYWVGDALLYHNGDEDCDAVYSEIHGIDEDGPSTGSGTFTVYPNPTSGVLTVSVRLPQWDSPTMGQTEYQISNLMGQTLLQ
ncbi:MAG: hypothetical protein IIT63_06110, partial [Prevotella sp.]|nr:hypothetical protein [Prevotella sp.]